jgi:hypothetical protein
MKRPARRTRRWRGSSAGARMSRSDAALDLHRRLSRRDRFRFRLSARLARRGRARSRRLLQIRAGRGRALERARQSRARRGQAGALERADGAAAGDLGARLKRKVGTRQQVIIDEVGPTVAKGPLQGRRAGDRRRGLCVEPPSAARRRDRHREDRARRRIRAVRLYGGIMTFNRTTAAPAFRRRSFDDDGSRRVRRQR